MEVKVLFVELAVQADDKLDQQKDRADRRISSWKKKLFQFWDFSLRSKWQFANFAKISIMDVKDSNGNILQDGDSVTVIKDLKVRGSSDVIKRGTMVKNIRLTDDPAEIDCRVNKTAMVLRTEFVKKA